MMDQDPRDAATASIITGVPTELAFLEKQVREGFTIASVTSRDFNGDAPVWQFMKNDDRLNLVDSAMTLVMGGAQMSPEAIESLYACLKAAEVEARHATWTTEGQMRGNQQLIRSDALRKRLNVFLPKPEVAEALIEQAPALGQVAVAETRKSGLRQALGKSIFGR